MFRTVALTALVCITLTLRAQSLRVERIGIKEGLSQGYVPALLQDREGFIWAGTKNGLNRYDGRVFRCFTHDPELRNTISDDQIWALKEQGDFLLIATGAGVLDFYHKKTRRFFHLPLSGGAVPHAPYTQQIFLDAQQNIWVLTGEFGGVRQICLIQLPAGFWDNLADNPALVGQLKPQFIPSESVFSAAISPDGNTIFYNTGKACYALDTRSQQSRPLNWPAAVQPVGLHRDAAGKIWSYLGQQISCFDGNAGQDFALDFTATGFLGVTSSNLALIGVSSGLLAIPTEKIRAAGRVDRAMAVWEISHEDAIICKLEDASGNLWLGQNGTGILKTNPGIHQVRHLFAGNSVYGAVFAEPNGTVNAALPVKLLSFPDASRSLAAQNLKQISTPILGHWRQTTDPSGNQWLFAAAKPVSKLIKTSPQGAQKSYEVPIPLSIPGNLTADADGFVWLAGERFLLQFDTRQETWKVHSLAAVFPINPEIFDLKKTPGGTLWLGTQSGLLEARPDGSGGFLYQLHTVESGALRNNAVASLLPDPKDAGLLWMATKGGGLTRLDLKSRHFSHIGTRNGLPNEVLYGLLADAQGHFWMSSNKGIIRFTPATGAIRNFTESDGLQSDEFNTWAYAPGPGGTLMFGGINGLNIFSPEHFSDNQHLPQVYITELAVNNQPVGVGDSTALLPQSVEFLTQIALSFEQRNITLSFSALEFTASVKNRFRWMLEGAETQWHPETTDRSATYLNLQPGTYTFKVMASNGDGVWNPTPAALKIIVRPPWYRTIWAYLVYAALLGGLIYGYLRFRLSRLRLQQQLELEHLNAERLKELDKFKSQVFTNVSHEFRTPLTVILGMAEQLEPQVSASGPKSAVTLIKRNGQNLLRLINQILDLAKLESNALKINYVQGDVLAFVRYAAESMHSLASMKNVLLRVDSQVAGGQMVMDYDPERLLHILHNLLSNAIKFTDTGGRVTLRIALSEDSLPSALAPGKYLQISVADTGVGIPAADLPQVFDRFFQANNQREAGFGGSGIGLSLTWELVKAMGGHISVETEVGKGSVFMVHLPVRQTAEPANEVAPAVQSVSRLPAVQESPGNRPQLLLIEDNPDVVEYLSVCLADHYRLDYAYNGRAGIERAFETIPDLIISDVMMPEKDGFEVCETLKNDERSSHIPLILLTAKVGVEDRIAGLRRGADAYLAKPFHPDELRAVLANLLEMRQKLQLKYGAAGEAPAGPIPAQQPDLEDAFLQKLRAAVEQDLSKADLSVEDISRLLGMSYPVVHRKVTALTGRSLTLYVRAIRLQKAQALLADPALSIAEVAYQTGFNDPKFFSRVFSEEFGVSPSVFRGRG